MGNGRLAGRRGQKARVVGEHVGLAVQLADVDHVRADAALVHGSSTLGLPLLNDSVALLSASFISSFLG